MGDRVCERPSAKVICNDIIGACNVADIEFDSGNRGKSGQGLNKIAQRTTGCKLESYLLG